MNTTVNPQLVEQVTSLVKVWNTADRRIPEMFHGWEQKATRAGLERGFFVQVGQLPGADTFSGEMNDLEQVGRAVYAAYQQGAVTAALDGL